MSDSNRSQLYYAKETTYGQVPATALKTLRFTGESLDYNQSFINTKEIRSDRQIVDSILTDAKSQGNTNHELSYGSFDDLFEGVLFSTWQAPLTYSALTISASATDNSIDDSASALPVFLAGQWIKIAGFATAGNNGYAQVVSSTAAKLVVSGVTLTTEAAGANVTVSGSNIRNGTTATSFTLEKQFTDIAQFMHYTGMYLDKANFKFSAGAVADVQFDWMGGQGVGANATIGTGAAVAANTNPVINATSNVANVYENGAALSGVHMKELAIDLSNNLRAQNAIGSATPFNYGTGEFAVKGTLQAYFQDRTLYDKYINGTESSLAVVLKDSAGNAYVLSMPRIKYTGAKVVASGANNDVMVDMSYDALRDKTNGFTFQIDKL